MTDMTRKIVIFGCGNMTVDLLNYPLGQSIITDIVADDNSRLVDIEQMLGYSINYHTSIDTIDDFKKKHCVISIAEPCVIKVIREKILKAGGTFINCIHPTADVSRHASIGGGVIIGPFTYVGPYAVIGNNCIINTHCTIGHDVWLGNGVVCSPHCDLNGGVTIGDYSFLSARTTIDPKVTVQRFCKTTSGITIKEDVNKGSLVFTQQKVNIVSMYDKTTGRTKFQK